MSDRLIRLLAAVRPDHPAADPALLRRVAASRDPEAFEALVRRHAALVWRTCRAVARDEASAADAFQAAFLALARKAGSVRGPSAAGWLHAVARRAAVKARARPSPEPLAADPPSPELPADRAAERSEAAAIVHAELARLPDVYRQPVALCHLAGLTQAEAAERLGLPVGTVATRVRRGTDRLRQRLVRRGLGAAAVGLLGAGAKAVPSNLIRTAAGYGAGSPPSAAVVALTAEVLFAMHAPKLSVLLAVVVGGSLAAVAVGVGPEPPVPVPVAAPPPAAAPAAEPAPPIADSVDRRETTNRLKWVGLSLHNYADAHDGRFPTDIADKGGKPLLSWRVAVLPYLELDVLYEQFRLDEPWDSDHNKRLAKLAPKTFRSPHTPAGHTRVKAFAGPATAFGRRLTELSDGTSNTLYAAEAGPPVPWTQPADHPFDPKGPLPPLDGPFADGFAALAGDGAVRWLSRPTAGDGKWLRAAVTRAGGEVYGEDYRYPHVESQGRPPTDRVKRQLDQLRASFPALLPAARAAADERFRLEAELRKSGPVPPPEPPAGNDLTAVTAAWDMLSMAQVVDRNEAARLWAVLEKRDPKAAERLRAELQKDKAKAAPPDR